MGLDADYPAEMSAGREIGWWCHKRRHYWLDREDAAKCCSPGWRRALRVGMLCGVPACGHYWLRVEESGDA